MGGGQLSAAPQPQQQPQQQMTQLPQQQLAQQLPQQQLQQQQLQQQQLQQQQLQQQQLQQQQQHQQQQQPQMMSNTQQPGMVASTPGMTGAARNVGAPTPAQLVAERQQNLMTIKQLQQTLEAAQQKDIHLKALVFSVFPYV